MKHMTAWMKQTTWALVLVFCLTSASSAGVIKETWYMSRGKANMKINNYNAAIEAFEKLLEIDPNNREAMELLGLAYENQGLTTKAVEHYDRYLKQFPDDADIAFKQANLLEWDRFSYRKNDAVSYYRMGLAAKDEPLQRHRLAKILSEDKATLNDALKEYRILVKGDPENKTIGDEYRKLLVWDDRYLSEAVKEYERAARLYPGDWDIRHQLAKLYDKNDDTGKAIKTYQALVAQKPDDLNLMEEYAKALAKSKDHFEEAKTRFEQVLARRDSYDTRLACADLLSRKKTMRNEALEQYRQVLAQKPDQTEVRFKYAALLAAEKKDLDNAITQYNIILKKNPKHVASHQQLAHAYAWKKDNDRSIYHANLALKYQPRNANASRLKTRMMKGREPRLTASLSMFNQDGDDDNYDMYGASLTTGIRADITAFVTGRADLGYEYFWKGENDLKGPLATLALEYRPDSGRTFSGSITHHAFRNGDKANEYGLEYVLEKQGRTLAPGIKRSLRYDSLLSLGSPDAFNPPESSMGTARSNMLYCRYETKRPKTSITGTPYAGIIETSSQGNNVFAGMTIDVNHELLNKSNWLLALVYRGQVDHYQQNYGGFFDDDSTLHPGGYFSPHLYLNNSIGLGYRYVFANDAELSAHAGPSLQYVRESSGETSVGADLAVAYVRELKKSLYLKAEGDFKQVADVYRKFTGTLVMTCRF